MVISVEIKKLRKIYRWTHTTRLKRNMLWNSNFTFKKEINHFTLSQIWGTMGETYKLMLSWMACSSVEEFIWVFAVTEENRVLN